MTVHSLAGKVALVTGGGTGLGLGGAKRLVAGIGMMLMREEHAHQGESEGLMAVSPLVQTRVPLFMAHVAGRRNDPLIGAFLDAAIEVWPDLVPTAALPEL